MGSTQLVTCEDTSKVKDSFWERYNMDYDVFCSTYTIEKIEITSTFDGHMIPADYIYALGEEGNKDNLTVILVHGLGGNRYTSDMKWMVEEEMRKMDIGLPISYMTFCGNIINKMELGFSYDDANVCDKIADIEIPFLVINSEADTLTPPFMGQEIYDSIHNDEMKMIWTVPDSEHTEIWLDYNQEYREKVQEVLGYIK